MNLHLNEPVLVPFGHDTDIVRALIEADKQIYISPQYNFWAKGLEILIKNYPTRYTMEYIKEKINSEYTGVITKSKYRFLFEQLFNKETAEFVDKIYQIEFDQKEKDIIIFLLTTEIERKADDLYNFKKAVLNLDVLNYIFDNINDYFGFLLDLKNVRINIISGELTNKKFGSVVDSVYRKSRIYTPQYLGFISVFTGEKEIMSHWENRMEHIAKYNLIHGGVIYMRKIPNEYVGKLNKILRKQCYKKMRRNIWRKPDITVKQIKKGIQTYF